MDEGSDKNWLKLTDYPTQKVYYRLENGRSLYTFYCEKLIKRGLQITPTNTVP